MVMSWKEIKTEQARHTLEERLNKLETACGYLISERDRMADTLKSLVVLLVNIEKRLLDASKALIPSEDFMDSFKEAHDKAAADSLGKCPDPNCEACNTPPQEGMDKETTAECLNGPPDFDLN